MSLSRMMLRWTRKLGAAALAQPSATVTTATHLPAMQPNRAITSPRSLAIQIWDSIKNSLRQLFRLDNSAPKFAQPEPTMQTLSGEDHGAIMQTRRTRAQAAERSPNVAAQATPRREFKFSSTNALHFGIYSTVPHILEPQEVRVALPLDFESLVNGGEIKAQPKAFQNSPVKVVLGRDRKTYFLVTSRAVQKGEVLSSAAPYVKTLGSFNRSNYCYHCHLRFEQPNQIKSAHTEDYFGFDTCRSIFDEIRARAAPLRRFMVENVGISANRVNDAEIMYIRTGSEKMPVSQNDLNLINLALEALIKRNAEDRGELAPFCKQVPQVTWGQDKRCVEMPPQPPESETLVQPYHPTYADFLQDETSFTSIPESAIPLLTRIADIVDYIVRSTAASTELSIPRENLIELLYCCIRYKKAIVRGHGRKARQTGLGLFPTARYFNYADNANCDYFFDENTNMVVRAKNHLERHTLLMLDPTPTSLAEARNKEKPLWAEWLSDA